MAILAGQVAFRDATRAPDVTGAVDDACRIA